MSPFSSNLPERRSETETTKVNNHNILNRNLISRKIIHLNLYRIFFTFHLILYAATAISNTKEFM